ncbi:MAG: TolC family protein [Verrucomicrobiae bacterium]|nr:TolC family protein [Verrucomicrobiae bacterium]
MLPVQPPLRQLRRAAPGALFFPALLIAFLGVLLGSGCSAKRYERAADREVYRIIEEAENRIFGRTNLFSIATPYSDRDPASIHPDEIFAERTAPQRRFIRLEEALDLAVRHSREYQTQKEQLYLAALTLTGSRYQFSPQFFAGSTAQVSGSPAGSDIGTVRSQVGVSQYLRTGGRLSAALANDLLRYFTSWSAGSGQGPRETAVSLISVQLTQPLLRGFGRNDPTVENLTQAERNVVYAIRTYTQFQHQFAVNVVNDYFSLLALKDVVRNNHMDYLRRVDITRYLEARAVDREQQSAVDDARTAELTARIGYINSVASYLNQMAAFKLTLGVPIPEEIHLDDADLDDLIAKGLQPIQIASEAGFRLAVDQHMDILNAIDRFEDSQRRLRVAADQLKADLGLFSTASLQSEAPTDYARFDLDDLRYSVGLSLDLPIDRLRERNAYRAAQVSFESQVRSLALTLDTFKDRIDRGLRTLEQRRLNYLNSQASLEVARRRVEFNALRLEAGRVQVRDLREAQDSLIAAQNQVNSTLVTYLQSRLQLLLDLGVPRSEQPAFWLEDPLSARLTPDQLGEPPLRMPDGDVLPPDYFLEPRP